METAPTETDCAVLPAIARVAVAVPKGWGTTMTAATVPDRGGPCRPADLGLALDGSISFKALP